MCITIEKKIYIYIFIYQNTQTLVTYLLQCTMQFHQQTRIKLFSKPIVQIYLTM